METFNLFKGVEEQDIRPLMTLIKDKKNVHAEIKDDGDIRITLEYQDGNKNKSQTM